MQAFTPSRRAQSPSHKQKTAEPWHFLPVRLSVCISLAFLNPSQENYSTRQILVERRGWKASRANGPSGTSQVDQWMFSISVSQPVMRIRRGTRMWKLLSQAARDREWCWVAASLCHSLTMAQGCKDSSPWQGLVSAKFSSSCQVNPLPSQSTDFLFFNK